MAKAGSSKKRKEREELSPGGAVADMQTHYNSVDDMVAAAERGKRFASDGFVTLHPKPVLDVDSEDTELWLMQLPFECELTGDAEMRTHRGEGGELCMTLTTADGMSCVSMDGPLGDYGGTLYVTPHFSAAAAAGAARPRAFDRVVTFMDEAYAKYVPGPQAAAAGPAGRAATAAGEGEDGSGGHKREKKRKKKSRPHEGQEAAAVEQQQEQPQEGGGGGAAGKEKKGRNEGKAGEGGRKRSKDEKRRDKKRRKEEAAAGQA